MQSTKAKALIRDVELSEQLRDVIKELAPLRRRLMSHPIYKSLHSVDDLRIFMSHHVFAVWDFMSLLKFLQVELTCVRTPWLPPKHAVASRLINEIVLAEESDSLGDGRYISHFALYLDAMKECGANTRAVDDFITSLQNGHSVEDALACPEIPESVQTFVAGTFAVIATGKTWEVASAFTFGREEIIPDMFRNFELGQSSLAVSRNSSYSADSITQTGMSASDTTILRQYLDLHIITDEHEHVPLAFRLLQFLCQEDERKWHEVLVSGSAAIERRIALWDGVCSAIGEKPR
jgi:hypothetical protein